MSSNRIAKIAMAVCLIAILAAVSTAHAYMEHVPRMTKETLREMLESPDLVILDIRTGMDWNASEFKIPGAVRKDPRQFDTWKGELVKGKTVVLYCA